MFENLLAMKHILIPIDFTAPSCKLLSGVLSMYPEPGMRFYLLYSEEVDIKTDTYVTQKKQQERKLKFQLKKLEGLLAPHQKIISLQWKGSFIENLKEAVLDYDIDLIVLKTSCSAILNKDKEVSCTKDVIARVKCSILMVPKEFQGEPPKQVVLLSDFNFMHWARSANTLVNFVRDNKSNLHILQLYEKNQALKESQNINKSFLESSLGHLPHRFHIIINKTVNEALQSYMHRHHIDLIVLFAKNINILEPILFSNKNDLGKEHQEEVPFLIIHE